MGQNTPSQKHNKKEQESINLPKEIQEVRDNEEASVPDQAYAFDESNTDNEEYHDVDDDFEDSEINYED
ncbi:MAG: hypothetical protein AB7I27_18520 [Bacteriovoracaceae bacterium]